MRRQGGRRSRKKRSKTTRPYRKEPFPDPWTEESEDNASPQLESVQHSKRHRLHRWRTARRPSSTFISSARQSPVGWLRQCQDLVARVLRVRGTRDNHVRAKRGRQVTTQERSRDSDDIDPSPATFGPVIRRHRRCLCWPGRGPNRAARAVWCQVTRAVTTRINLLRYVSPSLCLEQAAAAPHPWSRQSKRWSFSSAVRYRRRRISPRSSSWQSRPTSPDCFSNKPDPSKLSRSATPSDIPSSAWKEEAAHAAMSESSRAALSATIKKLVPINCELAMRYPTTSALSLSSQLHQDSTINRIYRGLKRFIFGEVRHSSSLGSGSLQNEWTPSWTLAGLSITTYTPVSSPRPT
jgi:hypothetical protein